MIGDIMDKIICGGFRLTITMYETRSFSFGTLPLPHLFLSWISKILLVAQILNIKIFRFSDLIADKIINIVNKMLFFFMIMYNVPIFLNIRITLIFLLNRNILLVIYYLILCIIGLKRRKEILLSLLNIQPTLTHHILLLITISVFDLRIS